MLPTPKASPTTSAMLSSANPLLSANLNATSTGSTFIDDVPPFEYQPLDRTKQQIRLLRLQETGTHEELRCNIELHDLDALPRYRALSYMWGCPEPTHPLLVNGKRLYIRQNLQRFIREYPSANRSSRNRYNAPSYDRFDEDGGLLWIDQICIDQTNISERNHQVNLMSRIYKQCEFVITWISDTDDSDTCSTASQEFTKSFRPEALLPILLNPYFTRLWIVQEIILAPFNRVLVEGGNWLLWSDMQGALAHMSEGEQQQLKAARSVAAILLKTRVRDVHAFRDLSKLFADFHRCDCEDPRDKIFGVIGLVNWPHSNQEGLDIQVDYSKSVRDTFAAVAESMYRSHSYIFVSSTFDRPGRNEGIKLRLRKVLLALGLSMGLNEAIIYEIILRAYKILPVKQSTHIIPQAELDWWKAKDMSRYNLGPADTLDDTANAMFLQADLHIAFDKSRFVFVPKPSGDGSGVRLIFHLLKPSAEYEHFYHNRELHKSAISTKMLFAQFAWTLFPLLRAFLSCKEDQRLTIRTAAHNQGLSRGYFPAAFCKQFSVTSTRKQSLGPKKRKSDKDVIDNTAIDSFGACSQVEMEDEASLAASALNLHKRSIRGVDDEFPSSGQTLRRSKRQKASPYPGLTLPSSSSSSTSSTEHPPHSSYVEGSCAIASSISQLAHQWLKGERQRSSVQRESAEDECWTREVWDGKSLTSHKALRWLDLCWYETRDTGSDDGLLCATTMSTGG